MTEGAEEFISGVILFDETIRQSPRTARRSRAARKQGHHPRHQGRHGREAAGRSARRDDHGGPRRAPGAARGVLRARREVHEVARGDLDRVRVSRASTRLDERARARPVCGAVSGGWARPDRRAGGPDGRGPLDRRVVPRHRPDAPRPLHRALRPAGRARGMLLKPNMILSGYDAADRADVHAVAEMTIKCLRNTCRRPCRGSSSCRAARPTRTPLRISTR